MKCFELIQNLSQICAHIKTFLGEKNNNLEAKVMWGEVPGRDSLPCEWRIGS